MTSTNLGGGSKAELPKRFYTTVTVGPGEETGFAVLLDGKAIRTPARRRLQVPVRPIAEALAAEWDAQVERIDPSTMPLTRLANTVVDGIADDPAPVREDFARYVETDLLFYRAAGPERLVQRQHELWDPLIGWAEKLIGRRFILAEGVMHVSQPAETVAAFRHRLAAIGNPFAIAALHQMTTLTGSALLALAVAEGRVDVDLAWAAAHVDEDWNIEQWGPDEEAAARRESRQAEMRVAAAVVRSLRQSGVH